MTHASMGGETSYKALEAAIKDAERSPNGTVCPPGALRIIDYNPRECAFGATLSSHQTPIS